MNVSETSTTDSLNPWISGTFNFTRSDFREQRYTHYINTHVWCVRYLNQRISRGSWIFCKVFTCLNFALLPSQNPPGMWHRPFNPNLHIEFGGVISFAVRVWSWKLWQIKGSLAFGAAFAVPWIKTSCCVESSKHRARRCDVLMTLRSTMIWSAEPAIAALKAHES